MIKRSKKSTSRPKLKPKEITIRHGRAKDHGPLADNLVHIFVDDQNLFWGIVNKDLGAGFRIDFGRLLLETSQDSNGKTRGVASAYIAGVIPDDDSFWKVAEAKGFKVKRGYLGSGKRSKQDDAYLITEIVSTVYEVGKPSTIVLVAGDADYKPPLERALEKGWRSEVMFVQHGISAALENYVHEFRIIPAQRIQYQ